MNNFKRKRKRTHTYTHTGYFGVFVKREPPRRKVKESARFTSSEVRLAFSFEISSRIFQRIERNARREERGREDLSRGGDYSFDDVRSDVPRRRETRNEFSSSRVKQRAYARVL